MIQAVSQSEDPKQPGFDDDRAEGVALEFVAVTKKFRTTTAVDEFSLTVQRGEFMTLLGPSGSGKTTLLKMLAGFEVPSAGKILLGGREISSLPPADRGIGMVFQQYALFPHLTVSRNIAYGLRMRKWSKRRQQDRVDQMLDLVRLSGLGGRYPAQLSGGQQQRVALARALAFGPDLLLMDEPLGALDRSLRLEMEHEIRRIHRELHTTIIYVTHDQEEALTLSDRVAIIRHGKLIAVDRPQALYQLPTTAFVGAFFGGCNLIPVQLVSSNGEHAVIESMGQTIKVGSLLSASDREGVLAIPASALHIDSHQGPAFVVRASVDEVLYLGDLVQVTCHAIAEEHVTLVMRRAASDLSNVVVGQQIVVSAPIEQLVVVPDDRPSTSKI